jgi:hypothetical protein
LGTKASKERVVRMYEIVFRLLVKFFRDIEEGIAVEIIVIHHWQNFRLLILIH